MPMIQQSEEYLMKSQKKTPRFFVFLFIICLTAGAVYYVISRDVSLHDTTASAVDKQPKLSPSQVPTATVTPLIDKSQIRIEVLNGSGVKGKAKEIADLLTQNGYTIVRTGNAETFSYQGVTLKVAVLDNEIVSLLKKDLENIYSIASVSADDALGENEVRIIVGE
jgi:hypothetical protein